MVREAMRGVLEMPMARVAGINRGIAPVTRAAIAPGIRLVIAVETLAPIAPGILGAIVLEARLVIARALVITRLPAARYL